MTSSRQLWPRYTPWGFGPSRPAQHRGSVSGPAAESRSRSDAFTQGDASVHLSHVKGPHHQVVGADWHGVEPPNGTIRLGGTHGDRRALAWPAEFEFDDVDEIHGDHLGVDEVIAVAAATGDAQRQSHLGGSGEQHHDPTLPAWDTGVGQTPPRHHVEFLGALRRLDARRSEGSFGHHPGE